LKISRLAVFGPSSSCSSPLSDTDLGSEDPLTLPVIVNNSLSASLLMDSGASSQFIDVDYAERMNLEMTLKPESQDLILADGKPSPIGKITHTCTLKLTIDQHEEDLTFQVTKLAGWDLIVGKPWLRRHNPLIDWEKNTCAFHSGYCQSHCLPVRPKPSPPEPKLDRITLISRAALRIAIARPGAECFVIAIIAPESDSSKLAELSAQLVPPEYHDFLSIFSEEEAKALPPRRYVDHAIPLIEGGKPPFGRMYSMSDNDLKELKLWIEENLAKSFIRASSSSAASPIIIVRRPGSAPRICVDYRALNDITIKDRHPLPRIEETLNQIRGARYFTKIDLRRYFHQIRIQEGDEWKTAFRSRYGLYEFLVMPFGLTNAPATAQRFMNDTLREYLDLFCVVYIDDILIYSNNKKEHREQVRKVLAKLKEAGLYVKPEKCEFSVEKTTFLGFVISADGIEMDPAKVDAILNWEAPKCAMLPGVCKFLPEVYSQIF
jgi:hypothetical protein